MEIVRIGEWKMKIALSDSDMRRYGVTTAVLQTDGGVRRRALDALFAEVKKKTGIDLSYARTLLDVRQVKEGGCEILATLLEKKAEAWLSPRLYYFGEKEALKKAARLLRDKDPKPQKSSLYRFDRAFYLFLFGCGEPESKTRPAPYQLLEEYGRRIENTFFQNYIKEYGEAVYEVDALEKLAAKESTPDNSGIER